MSVVDVSVVIATYTGEEHIGSCLESVLAQKNPPPFEVVVVIDGPNKVLRQRVDSFALKCSEFGVKLRVHQFKKNMGRFAARLKGAEDARASRLLFLDDRTTLSENFLEIATKSKFDAIIANAVELSTRSYIGRTLALLRQKVYSGGIGETFESFEITTKNFEGTAKGTAGFWVEKSTFVDICHEIKTDDLSSVNEDTRIFRALLARNKRIQKNSQTKVYYTPRTGVKYELSHLYNRGPRFVDYYLKPGTRYFVPTLFGLSAILVLVLAILMQPELIVNIMAGLVILLALAAGAISRTGSDFFVSFVALPMIIISFGSGVVRSLLKTLLRKFFNR